jgi:hypothetical protein
MATEKLKFLQQQVAALTLQMPASNDPALASTTLEPGRN